jgi:hypothetical protein
MKTLTMTSMLAVAALTVAAGSAAAQTYKAEIPMSFRALNTVMAPGSYQFSVVSNTTGKPTLVIRNLASHASAMVMSYSGSDAPKAWRASGHPVVSFACSGKTCSLSALWDGDSVSTLKFPVAKLPAAEAERASVVTFSLARTD